MNKNYLHIFNDLLKELEKRKKNPFPKRKSSEKDTNKKDDKEKDSDKGEDDEYEQGGIAPFLKRNAPSLNVDYGTAGSKLTEKIILNKLIKK